MSNLELDNAIIQASQQLSYATIRPDQNRAIKSFMEGHDVFISRASSVAVMYRYLSRSQTTIRPTLQLRIVGVGTRLNSRN